MQEVELIEKARASYRRSCVAPVVYQPDVTGSLDAAGNVVLSSDTGPVAIFRPSPTARGGVRLKRLTPWEQSLDLEKIELRSNIVAALSRASFVYVDHGVHYEHPVHGVVDPERVIEALAEASTATWAGPESDFAVLETMKPSATDFTAEMLAEFLRVAAIHNAEFGARSARAARTPAVEPSAPETRAVETQAEVEADVQLERLPARAEVEALKAELANARAAVAALIDAAHVVHGEYRAKLAKHGVRRLLGATGLRSSEI